MMRVQRPGGRLVVAVWDALERVPGYAAVVDLLARLFDEETADLLRSPDCPGERRALRRLFTEAGVPDVEIETLPGEARFPSIRDWMHTDVRGWTLAERIDDEQFEQLVAAAETDLARFVSDDGTVRFSHPALVVSGKA